SRRPRHPARRARTPDRSGRERRHRRVRPPRPRTHRRLALPGEPAPVTADPHTDTTPSASEETGTTAAPSEDAARRRRAGSHPHRVQPWLRAALAMFLLAWGGNHYTPHDHLYEEGGGSAGWRATLLPGMYVGGLIPGLLVESA